MDKKTALIRIMGILKATEGDIDAILDDLDEKVHQDGYDEGYNDGKKEGFKEGQESVKGNN